MFIDDFLVSISLPIRCSISSFTDAFVAEKKKILQRYEECQQNIKNIDEFESSENEKLCETLAKILEPIKNNFQFIENILEYYYGSNMKEAQDEFDRLMENLKDDLFIGDINGILKFKNITMRSSTGTVGNEFYRIRSVQAKSDEIGNNHFQLFHIPISSRHLCKTERFSLPGFPCLYLATNLPLAWQECGCPSSYYYSKYQYKGNGDDKFISLYTPYEIFSLGYVLKYNNFELWLDMISKYLKTLPLVLACSFVNINKDAAFKQEYIISQMLMQWVQRNFKAIKGIIYFSCVDDTVFGTKWDGYNIALPVTKPFEENNYSKSLINMFNWSKPDFYSVPFTEKKEKCYDNIYQLIKDIEFQRSQIKFNITRTTDKEICNIIENILRILRALLGVFKNESVNLGSIIAILKLIEKDIDMVWDNEYIKKIINDIPDENASSKIKSFFLFISQKLSEIKSFIERNMVGIWNRHHDEAYVFIYYTNAEQYKSNSNLISV